MCEIKYIKSSNIFPAINEILNFGMGVKIAVTGRSMRPFLREGFDSVELYQGDLNTVSVGDIVIIQRDNKEYVMHRIIKKTSESFYIIGDAQCWVEGPLSSKHITAVVRAVWRDNRRINCSNFCWRFLSIAWIVMLPIRRIIFKAYRLVKSFLQ